MSDLSIVPPPGSYVRLIHKGLTFSNMPQDLDGSPMDVVLERIRRRHIRQDVPKARRGHKTPQYRRLDDPFAFELIRLS